MISKRLFLKGMSEDLRHKIWMLALSLLGSFLTLPVVWLLRYSDVDLSAINRQITVMTSQEYEETLTETINSMADFFGQELMLSASVVAILGAVVTGLEAFHYLQQKSMVDTYHSLPVSRTQLFAIKYINGLLIWLVPYLLCSVLALALSGVLLARVGGIGGLPRLILEAGKNTLVLVIAFLLVYHMMLLATMLTGNMLNTLTVAVILGGGVIAIYGLILGFMATFFHTYYAQTRGLALVTYTSPLTAPIVLVGSRVDRDFMGADSLLPTMLICLGIALVLGALAWISYLKRPSERAGRGLELPWLAWPLRLVVSIMGGLGGWLFMYFLVSSTAWYVFGALLAGILTYGVLDVIFTMDFKAFFRHKWSMGAAVVVMLLICAGFQEDWMGYDRYLPDQEEIREASIVCRSYTSNNYNINYNISQILSRMRLTDPARIHAFLERGIENGQGGTYRLRETQAKEPYRGEDSLATDSFYVRVVLENGRSYYRVYSYYEWDEDVVLPLLCSEEYADGAYRLAEDQIEACASIRLTSGVNSDSGIEEVLEREVIRELAEAYNRDLSEQYQTIILGQDRLLGQMIVRIQQGNINIFNLDIFENMTHTLEAMEKNGIRIFNQPTEAEDVESITFQVDGSRYWHRGDLSISPAERIIRGYFGVYPESQPEISGEETDAGPNTMAAEELPFYSFTVTDPAEIARLMPLIQYSDMRHGRGIFTEGFVENVRILDRQGAEWGVCLRQGALPEEFIRKFLEEAEAQ